MCIRDRTEAVRLREEQAGPLEDSEAVRQALAQGGSLPRRILTRAHWLGRREGLLDAQRTWRQGSRLALALLLVLALASGAGLAFAALGDGQRPVNVFWALASLLGLQMCIRDRRTDGAGRHCPDGLGLPPRRGAAEGGLSRFSCPGRITSQASSAPGSRLSAPGRAWLAPVAPNWRCRLRRRRLGHPSVIPRWEPPRRRRTDIDPSLR